jgi:hypothetical protein
MDLQPILSTLGTFLPPFFGVLVAFLIQRTWTWNENRDSKKKLLKDIKQELTLCFQRLIGQGNLLPTDIWKSTVSTGSLKLIPYIHKFELASIYFRIECHNYEAEKVREVSIIAATTKEKSETTSFHLFSDTERLHNDLSRRLVGSEAELKKDIEHILSQKMWD